MKVTTLLWTNGMTPFIEDGFQNKSNGMTHLNSSDDERRNPAAHSHAISSQNPVRSI
jgi:hypothetical protein